MLHDAAVRNNDPIEPETLLLPGGIARPLPTCKYSIGDARTSLIPWKTAWRGGDLRHHHQGRHQSRRAAMKISPPLLLGEGR